MESGLGDGELEVPARDAGEAGAVKRGRPRESEQPGEKRPNARGRAGQEAASHGHEARTELSCGHNTYDWLRDVAVNPRSQSHRRRLSDRGRTHDLLRDVQCVRFPGKLPVNGLF